MRNISFRKILISLSLVAIFWELASCLKIVDPFLFPAPHKVIKVAYEMFLTGELQGQVMVTLVRFFAGVLWGGIFGLVAGVCCGMSKKVGSFIEPSIYLVCSIPRFVLLPFTMLIFGLGDTVKIIFIGMSIFFPVAINTISGINCINKDFLEIAKHYGAKRLVLYSKVILPGSLPSIFTGLRIGMGIAFTYVIVIEFLIANDGLGAMMWLSLQTLRIDRLFLGAVIIGLLNMTFIFFLRIIERIIMPWNE